MIIYTITNTFNGENILCSHRKLYPLSLFIYLGGGGGSGYRQRGVAAAPSFLRAFLPGGIPNGSTRHRLGEHVLPPRRYVHHLGGVIVYIVYTCTAGVLSTVNVRFIYSVLFTFSRSDLL